MAAEKGRAFLLKIGDGGAPEAYETVAGLKTTQISINNEVVDVTNKASGGWRELLAGAGVRTVSVSGSGIFTGSAAEALLREKVLAASIDHYRVEFESGDRFEGAFQVTALDFAGAYNAARTFTLSLDSSGPVSFVEAA
jgi:TP901-1 family phage major tail protein